MTAPVMLPPDLLAMLGSLSEKATPPPWDEEYVCAAVRHVARNMDRGQLVGDDEDDAYTRFQWDRYGDGPFIVALVNAWPAIASALAAHDEKRDCPTCAEEGVEDCAGVLAMTADADGQYVSPCPQWRPRVASALAEAATRPLTRDERTELRSMAETWRATDSLSADEQRTWGAAGAVLLGWLDGPKPPRPGCGEATLTVRAAAPPPVSAAERCLCSTLGGRNESLVYHSADLCVAEADLRAWALHRDPAPSQPAGVNADATAPVPAAKETP